MARFTEQGWESKPPEHVALARAVRELVPGCGVYWRREDGDTFREAMHLQYGHSRIYVPSQPKRPKTRPGTVPIMEGPEVWTLGGRQEGGKGHPTTWMDLPLKWQGKDLQGAVAWAVEILRAGRTCEVGPGVGLHELAQLMPYYQTIDHPMESVYRRLRGLDHGDGLVEPPWILDPDYQRGAVWTEQQREQYVGTLLQGGQTPLIFVQDWEGRAPQGEPGRTGWDVEVIDGQQRLRAIMAWIEGECAAELVDGRRVWYRDTNEIDRSCLPCVKVAKVNLPRVERLRFYLLLNTGGTVHTAEEIAQTRALLAAELAKGGDHA